MRNYYEENVENAALAEQERTGWTLLPASWLNIGDETRHGVIIRILGIDSAGGVDVLVEKGKRLTLYGDQEVKVS